MRLDGVSHPSSYDLKEIFLPSLMKTNPTPLAARSFAAVPFVFTGAILLALSTIYGGSRARITASPNAPQPSQFSGTYDPHIFPCATPKHHFDVTTGKTRIVVQTSAVVPTNDITVTLLFGPDVAPVPLQTEDAGTSSEALVYAPPAWRSGRSLPCSDLPNSQYERCAADGAIRLQWNLHCR